jgi:glucose-6-phosphate isomerase
MGGRPVTFGWGPRFLHSTGQFHKGGPQVGVFLQVTGAVERDVDVPGRPYSFGRLQMAQALGDLGALTQRGRPAVRLHLRDRATGVRQLLAAAAAL